MQRTQTQDLGNSLIDALADWLMVQALTDSPLEQVFEGTCKRIYAAGIPLSRAHVGFFMLHPLFEAQSLIWTQASDVSVETLHHQNAGGEVWERSPLHFLTSNNLRNIRRHLTGKNAIIDFPLLADLKQAGMTDYLGFCVNFGDDTKSDRAQGLVGSWSTERKDGFNESEIQQLNRIEQRLAVAFKIGIKSQISKNILAAYLGPEAGERVLNGQIKRGDGEVIHAVIWYSDMRNSTRMAATLSGDEFLQALNRYFECTAGAVIEHGGQVLRFIGDAVLAIFPTTKGKKDTQAACTRALKAASAAERKLAQVNQQHTPKLDFGLGLHVGDVLFGNIGIPERVEFSVIGPAANEVARIEELTKKLKRRVLVSDSFTRCLGCECIDLGPHKLKGVKRPISVFAPATDIKTP